MCNSVMLIIETLHIMILQIVFNNILLNGYYVK